MSAVPTIHLRPTASEELLELLSKWALGKETDENTAAKVHDLAVKFDISQTDLVFAILKFEYVLKKTIK